jgi:hypothetical protein
MSKGEKSRHPAALCLETVRWETLEGSPARVGNMVGAAPYRSIGPGIVYVEDQWGIDR